MLIKQLSAFHELDAMADLQTAVWGFEPIDVVPSYIFVAAVRAGGLVLGAFDEDKLVGYALGFRGYVDGHHFMYSHLVGVHPEYRDGGVGYDLKMAQKQFALENALEKIVWTFNPMHSRNARLNISKLGGRVSRYISPAKSDTAFKGFLTPRFEVTWDIGGSNEASGAWAGATAIAEVGESEFPLLVSGIDVSEHSLLSLPIPLNFDSLLDTEPERALAWQSMVMEFSDRLINNGFYIRDFKCDESSGHYLLERRLTA